MPRACWRCVRGRVTRDLSGEESCINCGAPATKPEPVQVHRPSGAKGTNRPRWDRVASSAWRAA